MSDSERVPFSILTGFLGAGKTTVLNRMLAAPQGRRIAVLVNELGRIAIDSRLILSRGGDVLELAGGCVCCKIDVKNDLWDGIVDIIKRSAPDHVVLETTGIAEPALVVEDFCRLPESMRERIVVAGVVCVVDADAGVKQIERRDEAREQVKTADRLLLSKLDLAAPTGLAAVHEHLRRLNPVAEIASFPQSDDGTAALVHWMLEERYVEAADPEQRVDGAPAHGHLHVHGDGQLIAVSFSDEIPVLAEHVMALIRSLGERLLRVKGFVYVTGQGPVAERPRAFIELAGNYLELREGPVWGTDIPRTELVLIGEDLDEAAIRRQLWACRAAGLG